jgi:hypothetical protein
LSAKNIPRQVVVANDEHDDEDEVDVKDDDDVDAGTTLLRMILLLTGVNAFTPPLIVDDSRNEPTIAMAEVSKRNFIIVNIIRPRRDSSACCFSVSHCYLF